MRLLKSHLSLIIALFGVLFTLQVYLSIDRAIHVYEERLNAHYALIVVTQKPFSLAEFRSLEPSIVQVTPLSTRQTLEQFQGDMSAENYTLLSRSLPHFYRISLEEFPSPDELAQIQMSLQQHSAIERVEGYAQTHNAIYQLLLLFKSVVKIFSITVIFSAALLIFKEMRLWQFQHAQRMSIMALFGAPKWLRSAVLFRLAVVDALIATVLVSILFVVLQAWLHHFAAMIGVDAPVYYVVWDTFRSLIVGLGIAMFLTLVIVLGHKEEV